MNKPQRIDFKRNEFVGGVILQKARWAMGTGQTESEYCTAGDFYIDTLEGRIEVENKTVNKEFNSKYLYPFHNNNWYCLPQGLDPGRKYWMLNVICWQQVSNWYKYVMNCYPAKWGYMPL